MDGTKCCCSHAPHLPRPVIKMCANLQVPTVARATPHRSSPMLNSWGPGVAIVVFITFIPEEWQRFLPLSLKSRLSQLFNRAIKRIIIALFCIISIRCDSEDDGDAMMGVFTKQFNNQRC